MSKKEEKDNQILMAATEEFLSKGIDAASMQNISDMAEVSKRTLYKYYPNKEDLYNALVDVILERVKDMYDFSYTESTNVEEDISKIIEGKIKLTLNDEFIKISRIIIGEMFKGRMPNHNQIKSLNDSEFKFIDWIKMAQKDNKISTDFEAEDIAKEFHSILKGQIYWPVLMGIEDKQNIDLEEVKQTTVNFFLRSFVR